MNANPRWWLAPLAGGVLAAQTLSVLPGDVELRGPRAYQKLVVEAAWPDGHQKDVTATVRLISADPKIATVDRDGFLRPVSDGSTTVTATLGASKAGVRVQVRGFGGSAVPSFRNHVIPVLTKVGCNAGACHGALAGKNGFKLTLRGYDPDTDHQVLTREGIGRRVSLMEPARSLMLLKPTLAIPHGGGKRFDVGSPEYNTIVDWIASGAPAPSDSDARIQGVDILPASARLEPGAEQQVLVRARYSDGHTEDVTRWVKFSSTDA
ncbi:MAG: Ig-like domain-containing protein, partial [Acidobacteria bacterium]|nr:Ig-like domain-containing protein [Acidobacteriota bacterium]